MKMWWYFCIHLLFYFPLSQSYDVEIETILRMNPEFVENIRKSMKHHDAMHSNDLEITFPGLHLDPLNKFMKNLMISRKLGQDDKSVVADYMDHLVQKGLERLELTGEMLYNSLKLQIDLQSTVSSVISDYLLKLQNYFTSATKQHAHDDVDREFIILDLLEIANEVLSNAENEVLYRITQNQEALLNKQTTIELIDLIKKNNRDDKIKEMKYICAKLDICKPFPGFSDYFAELLDVMLGFRDNKFHDFLFILKRVIKDKSDVFKEILGDKLAIHIGFQLQSLTLANGDLTNIKNLVVMVRSIITQRHKRIFSNDKDTFIKTKAIRILLDIIDKTFTFDSDDILTIYSDSVIKSVIDWRANYRDDIESIIKTFLNQAIRKFNYYWNAGTREEVKTLLEIIMKGKSKNKYLSEYLFKKGSDFVNADKLSNKLKEIRMKL